MGLSNWKQLREDTWITKPFKKKKLRLWIIKTTDGWDVLYGKYNIYNNVSFKTKTGAMKYIKQFMQFN